MRAEPTPPHTPPPPRPGNAAPGRKGRTRCSCFLRAGGGGSLPAPSRPHSPTHAPTRREARRGGEGRKEKRKEKRKKKRQKEPPIPPIPRAAPCASRGAAARDGVRFRCRVPGALRAPPRRAVPIRPGSARGSAPKAARERCGGCDSAQQMGWKERKPGRNAAAQLPPPA